MTVTAINSQATCVVLMTERDGLRTSYAGIRHVRRTLELNACPKDSGKNENRAKDRRPGNCIRTAMEDLHRRPVWRYRLRSQFLQRCRFRRSHASVSKSTKTCDYISPRLVCSTMDMEKLNPVWSHASSRFVSPTQYCSKWN